MDKRDFGAIRDTIHAVWKGVIESNAQMEVWYSTLKPYTYEQAREAVMAYIEANHYEPKPYDILGYIPKCKSNNKDFDPVPRYEMVNGKRTRVYMCQRCRDTGMTTWEDENQCVVGLPCDCPAGHYYYHWGWLSEEEQKAYINGHGHHGEKVGENWYQMQPR